MRTNIEIDDALMKQAMASSALQRKTKKAVIEEALQMLVKIRAQAGLQQLAGKVKFWDGYDYKAMRGKASEISPAVRERKVKASKGPRFSGRKVA